MHSLVFQAVAVLAITQTIVASPGIPQGRLVFYSPSSALSSSSDHAASGRDALAHLFPSLNTASRASASSDDDDRDDVTSSSAFSSPSSTTAPGPSGGRFQQFSASEHCRAMRMPLFMHPDKCFRPSASKGHMLLGSAAVCTNGTEARFEMYSSGDCYAGKGDERVVKRYGNGNGFGEDDEGEESPLRTCLDVSKKRGVRSVAWVCDGVPVDEDREDDNKKGGHSAGRFIGSIFGGLLMITFFGALALVALHKPTYQRMRTFLARRDGGIRL